MDRLKGKHVVITGAAGGMGLAACRRFAEEGARIFATDLRPGAAQEVQAVEPDAVTYAAADVTGQYGIRPIVESTRTALVGRIDVLHNNHGLLYRPTFLQTPT